MKNKIIFLILTILICLVSCDTITHYTLKVSVDRNPTLIIENQTGHPTAVSAPVFTNINHGGRTLFQPSETSGTIDVVYKIGQFEFTEQATMNDEDATVILTKRPPTITVVNQTGRNIQLITPTSAGISIGANYSFLPPALNQAINIVYRIGKMNLTEQVNMRNQDITVTLTRRPPIVTIVNNTGVSINLVFMRPSNTNDWIGGNIIKKDGIVTDLARLAQTVDVTESIVNGDRLEIPMENIGISGDRFDIRIDAVGGTPTFVKRNVQIRNDTTLTFTASDR